MVVDTSALMSILFNEDDREIYALELKKRERKYMTPINALEADMVIFSRGGANGIDRLERLLFQSNIDVIPFDRAMKDLAFEAFQKYGKGRHKAKLNMGDCCAYALARYLNEPLLFKGDDFSRTDIKSAI